MGQLSIKRASLRRRLRSALASKNAADLILDAIGDLETKYNALLAEFDNSTNFPKDDYVETLSVSKTDIDGES